MGLTEPRNFAPLDPDRLEQSGNPLIGRVVQVWNRIGSTNDAALHAAKTAANAGLVIFAEEQTSGRGRRGRVWLAPPRASILMSVVLFPPAPLADPAALVTLAAVAVASAVEPFARTRIGIKWPNDLYASGKKLGGILVERAVGTVIGIGLNIHVAPPETGEVAASCLDDLAGEVIDRTSVALAILRALESRYQSLLDDGLAELVDEWRRRAILIGETVVVDTAQSQHRGTLVAADPLDGLALRLETGSALTLAPRDVQQLRRG